jgi:hypothetical protein
MANDKDVPFALLYSVHEDDQFNDVASISTTSMEPPKLCRLQGAIGVPSQHPIAPSEIDLNEITSTFVPQFKTVAKSRKPLLMSIDSEDFPPALLEGVKWRGHGDVSSEVS